MNFKYSLFLVLCLSLTIFQSCKSDADNVQAFLGAYATVEDCNSYADTYDIAITEVLDTDNTVLIFNLYNIGHTITATIDGTNISFDDDIEEYSYSTVYTGSGTLNDDVINLEFSISSDGYDIACTSVSTRK